MAKRHRTPAAGGAAGLILLAVLLLAVLGPATPAQAQIDISGDWSFKVLGFGPEAIPCPATIEQTGAAFTIGMRCTNVGLGDFEGEINVETGAFTASGNIAGMPIDLAGMASPDGETIEGTWEDHIGFSGTISAVRKPPGLTPTPLPTLPAPANFTGTWEISFTGSFGGSCDALIEQNGEELNVIAACSLLGVLTLSGTIDQTTGAFTLSGLVNIEGVLDESGNTFTGQWSAIVFNGTLTGERMDIELIDLSGNWDAVLLGEVSDICALEIEQDLLVASAVLDCEELGASSMEGSVDPFSGSLQLFGTLGDIDTYLSGQLGPNGSYIFGQRFLGPVVVFPGETITSRMFIAVPAGVLERGIVLLNCRPGSEFLAPNCGLSLDSQFSVELYLAAAPAGGYTGIEAMLSWSEPLAFESVMPSAQCASTTAISAELSTSLTCSFAEQSDFAGDLLSISLTCGETSSVTDLEIDSASFTGADPDLGPPTLIDATITCVGPQGSGPGPALGDADCSSSVSSIDAALVLQYDAGLLETLDCQFAADTNSDGTVDSRDALLILQNVAGLI